MTDQHRRILLVSATENEVLEPMSLDLRTIFSNQLTTGVGMVATAVGLAKTLSVERYDLVVNYGIAGSFRRHWELGSVVQVVSDRLAELGVEDHGALVPADAAGLCPTEAVVFTTAERAKDLPSVNGITVNRVHGTAGTIQEVVDQFDPDVETMEGAAVAYACQQFGIPWLQIRAISNYVEPRNRDGWEIDTAIENLHTELGHVLKDLDDHA